jgi:hypothetical protein
MSALEPVLCDSNLFVANNLKDKARRPILIFFLNKSVWHRSLTQLLKPSWFWLRIRGDICNRIDSPLLTIRGVAPTLRISDRESHLLLYQWYRESPTLRIGGTTSRQLLVSLIQGVASWIFYCPRQLRIIGFRGVTEIIKSRFTKLKKGPTMPLQD